MSDVTPLTPLNTPETPPEHHHMTITNFNYEGSFLPGVICNIVVKADLGRSPGRSTALELMSSGQEWQFHIATDILWSRLAISHCYWYLVVKNGNFTLLLTSSGQEWQFHNATDI